MIQRIQSVYLLAAVLLNLLMFLLPAMGIDLGKQFYLFYAYGIWHSEAPIAIKPIPIILDLACAIGALSMIFMFRNRRKQARFSMMLIPLELVLMSFIYMLPDTIGFLKGAHLKPAFFFPLGAIIFILLAVRSIKKDEAKVRSADRLR